LFDDVANDQRKVIYQQRTEIMGATDLGTAVRGIQADVVARMLDQALPRNVPREDWDLDGLRDGLRKDFFVDIDPAAWLGAEPAMDEQTLRGRVQEAAAAAYDTKTARFGPELAQHLEKDVVLRTLDQHWREHLAGMDYLRQGIHLRSYAQKDYRYEYKREAYELFSAMLDRVKFDTASVLARIDVRSEADLQREEEERQRRLLAALQTQHADAQSALVSAPPAEAAASGATEGTQEPSVVRNERKVGRNEPCPCGSGKKYKQCHGQLE
jgi:preprotein translocase subunit SecA